MAVARSISVTGSRPRRRLVEDHHSGVLQEHTGEGEELLLPSREALAPGAELGVQPELSDPRSETDPLENVEDLLIRPLGEEREVVPDRCLEELYVLCDDTHRPTKGLGVEGP